MYNNTTITQQQEEESSHHAMNTTRLPVPGTQIESVVSFHISTPHNPDLTHDELSGK